MSGRTLRALWLLSTWLLAMPLGVRGGYPVFEVIPQAPSIHDSVAIHVLLGRHPTTCAPVAHGDASVSRVSTLIWPSDMPDGQYGYPVAYKVAVACTLLAAPRGQTCDSVPTDIEATVELGRLAAGRYTVMYGLDTATVFTVSPDSSGFAIGGLVRTTVYLDSERVMLERDGDPDPDVFAPVAVDTAYTGANRMPYGFTGLDAGRYRLTFEEPGFQTRVVPLELGGDTAVSVTLLPNPCICPIEVQVRIWDDSLEWIAAVGCTVEVTFSGDSVVSSILVTDSVGIADTVFEPTYQLRSIRAVARKGGIVSYPKSETLGPCNAISWDFQLRAGEKAVSVDTVVNDIHCALYAQHMFTSCHSLHWWRGTYALTNQRDTAVSFVFDSICRIGADGALFLLDIAVLDRDGEPVLSSLGSNVSCVPVQTTVVLQPGEQLLAGTPDLHFFEPQTQICLSVCLAGYPETSLIYVCDLDCTLEQQNNPFGVRSAEWALSRQEFGGQVAWLHLPRGAVVSADVYGLDGRLRHRALPRQHVTAGKHAMHLDSPDGRNGVEILRVRVDGLERCLLIGDSEACGER